MDFSLTTVFVNPLGETLATADDTGALTPGKIGIFKKSLAAPAVAADTQFVIAQGRFPGEMLSTSKKSDLIYRDKIIQYRKTLAVPTATQKVMTVNNFTVHCGDEFNLSLKIFERYLGAAYSDGLTRTYVVPQAPCCPCDNGDPCEVLDPEALVDALILLVNNDKTVNQYVVASKTGTGATTALVITGVAQPDEVIPSNVLNNPYTAPNVVDFFVYATKSAPNSFSQEALSLCDAVADVVVTTERTYPRGSGHEVATVEALHYSYQTSRFKHLYADSQLNVGFVPVTDLTGWYDEFLIKFRSPLGNMTWNRTTEQDNTVRVFVRTGADSTAFTTALDTAVGAASVNNEY